MPPAGAGTAARAGRGHLLTIAGLGLTAAAYLVAVDPARPGHYPGCPILLVTGRYCPGCGGLRALHELLHGHLMAALSSNLLVVAAVPVALAWWLDAAVAQLRGPPAPQWPRWAGGRPGGGPGVLGAALLLVVPITFGVLRTLPGMTWLAP